MITMLYESGIDPLIAMKINGHTDYQTTANIYTHIKEIPHNTAARLAVPFPPSI